MELTFLTKELREWCLNESLATRDFSANIANSLKGRLADFAAMPNASEVFYLPGNPRELAGGRQGIVMIDLVDQTYLTFQSGHSTPRLLDGGSVDWSKVTRIKILGLEYSHA